jgi:hypothetical protein
VGDKWGTYFEGGFRAATFSWPDPMQLAWHDPRDSPKRVLGAQRRVQYSTLLYSILLYSASLTGVMGGILLSCGLRFES